MNSVMGDIFAWRAEYADGSSLSEYDDAGHHGFAEVDHTRLARFVLVPQRPGLTAHSIRPTADGRVRFFRRRTLSVNGATGAQESERTIHCIGLEREQGRSIYYFVFADGRVLAAHDLNAV